MQESIKEILYNIKPLEIISVTLSISFYLLGIKQKSITWPVIIFMTIFNLLLYHKTGLYHTWIIGIASILTCFYGWYQWLYGGKNQSELDVTQLNRQIIFILIIIGFIGYFFIHKFLVYINSFYPKISALKTAFTFIGLWLTAKKKLESYILWFILNIISIFIFYKAKLYLITLKYIVYLFLSIKGYVSWKKSITKN